MSLVSLSSSLAWLTTATSLTSWRKWLFYGTSATAIAFLALESHKCWPLSYTVRLFMLLFRCRFFPQKLFRLDVPIVIRGRVWLSDLDYHGHVTNAQYALDADIYGRYPWISAVLMNTGSPYRANGFIGSAVFFFMREMRWGCRYRIETQAVGIDEKWIYTESRWYIESKNGLCGSGSKSGAASGSLTASAATTSTDPLAAVQLTRFVLKEGSGPLRGKTIPPREAFKDLGMEIPESFAKNGKIGEFFTNAYETSLSCESQLQQEVGDCGYAGIMKVREVGN